MHFPSVVADVSIYKQLHYLKIIFPIVQLNIPSDIISSLYSKYNDATSCKGNKSNENYINKSPHEDAVGGLRDLRQLRCRRQKRRVHHVPERKHSGNREGNVFRDSYPKSCRPRTGPGVRLCTSYTCSCSGCRSVY